MALSAVGGCLPKLAANAVQIRSTFGLGTEEKGTVRREMINEEAILRLAGDTDDKLALIALAENNLSILKTTIKRHFSGRVMQKRALISLLIRISWRTKYFVREHDDADKWIEVCAELECRRLQSEVRSVFVVPDRTATPIPAVGRTRRDRSNELIAYLIYSGGRCTDHLAAVENVVGSSIHGASERFVENRLLKKVHLSGDALKIPNGCLQGKT
jgi:hypothetical protein